MAPPWIVRTILAVLVFETGVCAAFLADYWPSLRNRETAFFQAFVEATQDEGAVVLDPSPTSDRVRLVRPLLEGSPMSYIQIDSSSDPQRLMSNPFSALNWADILRSTHKAGISTIAIDHPLSWDNSYELSLMSLDQYLSSFDRAVLCVDLRRSPNSQALPLYLKRSSVPLHNLTGNPAELPVVNRVSIPPSATGTPNVIYSFRILENEIQRNADGSTAPAPRYTFAIWDQFLIPSFPIALAMARFRVAPEDVHVDLGRHIRLGNGPVIPIDDHGLIRAPLGNPPGSPFTLAVNVWDDPTGTVEAFGDQIPDCGIFIDTRTDAPVPWQSPARLLRISSTLDALPRPGPANPHPRLPLIIEILLFGALAILAAVFLTYTSFNRALAFGLLAVGSLVVLAGILDLSPNNTWTPIFPILFTALAGWILCHRMHHQLRRKTTLNANSS